MVAWLDWVVFARRSVVDAPISCLTPGRVPIGLGGRNQSPTARSDFLPFAHFVQEHDDLVYGVRTVAGNILTHTISEWTDCIITTDGPPKSKAPNPAITVIISMFQAELPKAPAPASLIPFVGLADAVVDE